MHHILTKDGFYLDDSVRENFGRRYRIKELNQAISRLKQSDEPAEIYVILGPGVPGEDQRSSEVPKSFILKKKSVQNNLSVMENNLQPGCRLARLEDVSQEDFN